MDKLQLYITISHGGYKNLVDINGVESVKQNVCDLASALDLVDYDPKEKNILYILKSTDQGVFLVIIRTIPERPTDNLASWLFIPSSIVIPESEICSIADEIVDIVSNPAINTEHMKRLHALLDKTYPEQADAGNTVGNKGWTYAHRYFGESTGNMLSDLIGSKRYQTSYLPYSGVILAAKDKVTAINGKDLTDEPLEPMVRIFPPKTVDSRYRPLIFGVPFDKPYLVPLMETIEVLWESPTEVDVHQSIMVNRPDMTPEPISMVMAGEKTADEATAHDSGSSEPDTADDEQKEEEKPHVADTHRPVVEARPIGSGDRVKVYNFEIPSKSAAISGMIQFTINTHSDLNDSPIDGYELSDDIQEGPSRSNHLVYVPGNSLQNNALWAVGGFIIGILLTLLCTCGGKSSKSDNSNDDNVVAVGDTISADTTKAPVKKVPEDISMEGAIKYLDTNKAWTKSDLETYPDLRGLYTDLNTINRDRIIDVWGKKLSESREFAKIVEHAKNGKKKKPRLPEGQNTYNKPNDETIVIRTYLNKIDP